MFLTKLFELIISEFVLKENFTDHDECPINKYKSRDRCIDCPMNSSSPKGSTSIDDCYCSHGYVKNDRNQCEPCNKYGGLCEYIDLDIEKYKLTRKNEEINKDLNKKIINQDSDIKSLEQQNSMIIKNSKISQKNFNNYTNQYNKYKNYNIILLILNLIIGYLLFRKYKKFE